MSRRYSMGSHLASLNSWIRMFNSVCVVLQDIIKFGNLTQRNEVDGIYDALASIKFVFILHFMIALIRITDDLCQALQYKSHDILTQCSWCRQLKCSSRNSENMGGILCFKELKLFCKDYEIEVPNLSAPYKAGRGRLVSREITSQLSITIGLIYSLIIRLVLTLPVSTTTTKRAFSAMKNVKTRLHNKMEDDFHSTYLVAYIEKEIA
ncbi:hypothetical protein PVK06_040754 [Gossypium arboreum]|uniref:HAT C-terminal dimerisation domain-containing protein n=1 Tax=Gossypium arboreum TaxID=29729 RepID=A0ABR0N6C9_GOSAR|nr:hypothetical protein PVK06_040754 [Gossypium arboreum]